MKFIAYTLITALVVALAFWAYHQNYQTQAVLKETRALQHEIGALRERVSVLRAEWAYLNRPDRLRDLADMNFDRLRLFPLAPSQFGEVDDVPEPDPVAALLRQVVADKGDLAR
jgi:hypothetical protein